MGWCVNLEYTSISSIANQLTSQPLNKEKATALIIERARQLVNKLITQRGHDNPPFFSEEYASLLGVNSIEKTDLGKTGGLLLRFPNGPKIKINKNDPLVRQNFSCAHELGHLLFGELKLENYTNSIEHRTFNPPVLQRNRAKAIEKLCDAAATEFLMPEFIFKKHLLGLGISINSIERLADTFRVSIQSAAIRASEVSLKSCIVLKWQPQKNQSKSLELSWPKKKLVNRVQFSPSQKIVEPPSTLHKAYYSNSLFQDDISFKVGKETKRFPAEIKGFGRGENRYVISLAFLNR
jgi:Zn-dependent peptidase ImmA (M78 family)